MSKVSTYFIAFGIICGCCNYAIAGTEPIANALTQGNSYLKEAGLVQKQYSGIAREITSTKIGLPENLAGGKIAAARAKAAAVQDKINIVQEQVEAAQEAQAAAMAKIADLNEKVSSAIADAQSTLNEGISITEQYKTGLTDAIDTVKNAPDLAKGLSDRVANSVKDTAMGTVNSVKGTVNSVKDQAVGIANDSKTMVEKETSSDADMVSDSIDDNVMQSAEEMPQAAVSIDVSAAEDVYRRSPMVAVPSTQEMIPVQSLSTKAGLAPMSQAVTQAPLYNKASAIQSAAIMADNSNMEAAEIPVVADLATLQMSDVAVNAADVMAAAAVMPIKDSGTEVQRSRLNIEQQLQHSSNRAEGNKMKQLSENKKLLSAQPINQKAASATEKAKGIRREFNTSVVPNKENLQIQDSTKKELISSKAEKLQKPLIKEKSNDKNL